MAYYDPKTADQMFAAFESYSYVPPGDRVAAPSSRIAA